MKINKNTIVKALTGLIGISFGSFLVIWLLGYLNIFLGFLPSYLLPRSFLSGNKGFGMTYYLKEKTIG